ncbi:MAG: Uma2 family endonuclease [Verrucomicrobiaceae bacterium]|nr:MAG: Uma2 family endonuclease [Verrucomicrobiaceae bacterium]
MTVAPKEKLTPEEYLALESAVREKSEFIDGEIRAMGGAGFDHNAIMINTATELSLRLRGKRCRVMAADLRVKSGLSNNYFYPDIVGFCGDPELRREGTDTLLNPVMLLEVLSPSTEGYDRGEKFLQYQQIASLQQYVLVSQLYPRVEIFTRSQGGRWEYEVISSLSEAVRLSSLDVEIPLAEIYRDVNFPNTTAEQS